jgi:hypothetical protein
MTKFIDQETYGRKTICKCPNCGKKHVLKMRWIGRGMPWKFCGPCKLITGDYDHIEDNGSAPWGAIHRTTALS